MKKSLFLCCKNEVDKTMGGGGYNEYIENKEGGDRDGREKET